MKYLKLFEEFTFDQNYSSIIKFNNDDLKNGKDLLLEFFKENNKLQSIGTFQEYEEYLKGVFPNSKVKGIWQHISKVDFDFDKFGGGNFGRGYYFSKIGDDYINFQKNNFKRHLAKLDVKSPKVGQPGEGSEFINKRLSEKYPNIEMYPGDPEFIEIEKELIEKYKKECDAVIGGTNGKIDCEIVLWDKDKVYLLGSDKDVNGFKGYISKNK